MIRWINTERKKNWFTTISCALHVDKIQWEMPKKKLRGGMKSNNCAPKESSKRMILSWKKGKIRRNRKKRSKSFHVWLSHCLVCAHYVIAVFNRKRVNNAEITWLKWCLNALKIDFPFWINLIFPNSFPVRNFFYIFFFFSSDSVSHSIHDKQTFIVSFK